MELKPLPPVTKTVYVYRPLPADLLQPCDHVTYDPDNVKTDTDLMGLKKQEEFRADCNEKKLNKIADLYRKAPE